VIPSGSKRFFLFSIASRPALGPTKPPVQWALGALSSEVKQQEHEAYQSPPYNAKVKKGVAILPLPYSAYILKYRGYLYLYVFK
jgi:hypothetical protein